MNIKIIVLLILTFSSFSKNFIYSDRTNYHPQEILGCPFCTQINAQEDEKYLILKRFQYCFVMLNKYPYSTGHIMILPYKHVKYLYELTHEERNELIQITSACVPLLEKEFNCIAVNVGINMGKLAGATIQDHLHVHLVPRNQNFEGFIEFLFDAKGIFENPYSVYKRIYSAFQLIELS